MPHNDTHSSVPTVSFYHQGISVVQYMGIGHCYVVGAAAGVTIGLNVLLGYVDKCSVQVMRDSVANRLAIWESFVRPDHLLGRQICMVKTGI